MGTSARATLCIPARDEVRTIGAVVRAARDQLVERGAVQEILVIDDRSTDGTGDAARRAGARVIDADTWCSVNGGSIGKGDALWASIAACRTELIGWIDGDVSSFDMTQIALMFDELRCNDETQLVKGAFRRTGLDGRTCEGRMTALTARPLLTYFYPDLGDLVEPLGGIFAMRTDVAAELSLDPDYGVDIGIAIDVVEIFGRTSLVEIPMGTLVHRNRPMESLTESATQVARAIVSRAVMTRSMANDEVGFDHRVGRRLPVRYFMASALIPSG